MVVVERGFWIAFKAVVIREFSVRVAVPARLCHTVSIHRLVSLSLLVASVIVCGVGRVGCELRGDGYDGHWLSFRGEG